MDKNGSRNDMGSGFNDKIDITAGSGIDVTAYKKNEEVEEKSFKTVLETDDGPKFDEYKPPQTIELTAIPQNKIPDAQPLSLDPKKYYTTPKKGVSKPLLIAAVFLLLTLVVLLIFTKLKAPRQVNDLGNKGEITWWGVTYEESDLLDLIKKFEEENDGVKVFYKKQSMENYRERLTSSLASGKGPDIFEYHNSWSPMFRNELSAVPDSVMSGEKYAETFYPGIVANLTTDKGIVGIPLDFDALTLFVNETIFSAAAKEPPTTWDEVRDLAILFAQKDDRKNLIQAGIPLGITKNVDYWPDILGLILIQNGINPGSPKFNETINAVGFYSNFYIEHEVWNDSFPNSTTAFAREQAPMYIGPSRSAVDIIKINSRVRFKTVEIPQIPKDDPKSPDVSYATYWVEGVWEGSSDKMDAWKLIGYLSEKEPLEKIIDNVKSRTSIRRPSPRIDMRDLLIKDPIVGSVIKLAPTTRYWYLNGNTSDGETGLNSQLADVYKGIVEPKTKIGESAWEGITGSLTSILKKYQLVKTGLF